MENIRIETKANGYKAESIQGMIKTFEKVAARLFPGCLVRHFYYGDRLDMADIVLGNGHYAHFNVTAKRVSLTGFTLSYEERDKAASMTHRDECYDGRLLELAGIEQ